MAGTATKFDLRKDDVVVYNRRGGTVDIFRNGESIRFDDGAQVKHYVGAMDDYTAEHFIAFLAKLFNLKAGKAEYGRSTISCQLID